MRNYLVSLVLLPLAAVAQDAPNAPHQRPPTLSDGWRTAAAESLGVDAMRLAALTASLRAWPELGVHSVLIERSGRLIYLRCMTCTSRRGLWAPLTPLIVADVVRSTII